MKGDKTLKRDAKAIWDALRGERRARAKLVGAEELAASAERIAGHANALKQLAARAKTAETQPMGTSDADARSKPKARRKKKKAKAAAGD